MRKPPELPGLQPIAPLGQGGTAEVIRVYSEKHRRELALKYPLSDDTPSLQTFTQLIRREYHLIGGLKFPGLVRLYDLATDKTPYLLMETCPGPTLDQCGRIEHIDVILDILSAIAADLEYLRANGIIHGDLKPHNIFLPKEWETPTDGRLFFVKLSDFSLGRFDHEPDSTRVGLGTVGYMAPETVIDSRVTYRSDLFALGVVAYQMLTGVHPFMDDDSDPVKTNARIREAEPVPLPERRNDIPHQLNEIVERLLAKDENNRPMSGWEVCAELRKAGARYPYEKLLRPNFFFASENGTSRIVSLIRKEERHFSRLEQLRYGREERLRLVLTGNFVRRNLYYDGNTFSFADGVHLPARLRREELKLFFRLPLSERKLLLKAAIIGSLESAKNLGIVPQEQFAEVPPSLIEVLRQFVTPRLVRAYSAHFGAKAEGMEMYELAAQLYIQAGSLMRAERCAYQAAIHLQKQHHTAEAVRLIKKVLEYAALTKRMGEMRQLLMVLGDMYKLHGDINDALATYAQIIALSQGHPPDKLLAETYKDLGDLHYIKQDSDAGLQVLHKALEIYTQLGDELEISHTLNNIGNIYWIDSKLKEALHYYRQALRIQHRLGARIDTASTLSNIGSVYVIKGRFQRAINLFNLSLNLKKQIGDLGEIARTLNNLGYVFHLKGEFEKALSSLKESLELNRRIGSKKEILFNLENLTAVMVTAGHLKESFSYLKEGIALSETLDDQPHIGVFNLSLGTVLKRMGKFSEAQQCFDVVEKVNHRTNDKMMKAQLLIQRAGLRHLLGDDDEALSLGQEALTLAEEINDKSGILNALLLLTKVVYEPTHVDRAYGIIEELHLTRERLLIDFNTIGLLLRQGREKEANAYAESVLPELVKISEDVEAAYMYNTAAELMITRQAYAEAKDYLARAQRFGKTNGLLPEMATTLTLEGLIARKMGEYEQSFRNYKNALRFHKQIADSLSADEDKQIYQRQHSVTFLVKEIKQLGEILGQKQRAGR